MGLNFGAGHITYKSWYRCTCAAMFPRVMHSSGKTKSKEIDTNRCWNRPSLRICQSRHPRTPRDSCFRPRQQANSAWKETQMGKATESWLEALQAPLPSVARCRDMVSWKPCASKMPLWWSTRVVLKSFWIRQHGGGGLYEMSYWQTHICLNISLSFVKRGAHTTLLHTHCLGTWCFRQMSQQLIKISFHSHGQP